MIDACTEYVQEHGLHFNASKNLLEHQWKAALHYRPTLVLNGTVLTKETTIKYLGAILGNNGSATHVAQRIKAGSGSFFQLQAVCMHGGGLSPDAIRHMYIRSLFNLL